MKRRNSDAHVSSRDHGEEEIVHGLMETDISHHHVEDSAVSQKGDHIETAKRDEKPDMKSLQYWISSQEENCGIGVNGKHVGLWEVPEMAQPMLELLFPSHSDHY